MTRKTNTQIQRDRTARIREAKQSGIHYYPYPKIAKSKWRKIKYFVMGEYGSSGYMECKKPGGKRLVVVHKKNLEFE